MRRSLSRWCQGVSTTTVKDISPEVLKNHCHHVINTLGPATPPEAFLFRGNAYFALGFPYLALADYNTAASVLNLSGSHQNKCYAALQKFPEVQVATYPSSDTHLHIYVTPFLGEGVAVKKINETVGRGVVALRPLPRGSTIIKPSDPWLRYPLEGNSCAYCCRPLPERVFPCKNPDCHEEYCSRDCRALALGSYHRNVCYNEDYRNIELDLYTQLVNAAKEENVSDRNAAAAQLLSLRLLSAALIMQVVPSVMAETRTFSGRLTFSPETLGGSLLHLYDRVSRALQVQTIVSYEEFIGCLARVTANSFQREDRIELYHARAMLNHSCAANAAEETDAGTMVATRDIKEGEGIHINYYPQLKDLPYAERSKELKRRGFDCHCAKCEKKV